MTTTQYEVGPAELEARKMTRTAAGDDARAIQMLARLIDDTRRDLAEHMRDCPHVTPPVARLYPQMSERIAELAADRNVTALR